MSLRAWRSAVVLMLIAVTCFWVPLIALLAGVPLHVIASGALWVGLWVVIGGGAWLVVRYEQVCQAVAERWDQ